MVESKDFPIFAVAFPGEIGTARESAFFALFLDSDTCTIHVIRRMKGKRLLSLLCVYILIHSYTVEQPPIHYFSYYGSASPTVGNKDKIGRLRSLCHIDIEALWVLGHYYVRWTATIFLTGFPPLPLSFLL